MRNGLALSIVTIALVINVAAISFRDSQRTMSSGRPDFTGVWMGIPPATPDPPLNPNEIMVTIDWYSPVALTHDETTLTVEYRTYSRSHAQRKFVYKLDGTPT